MSLDISAWAIRHPIPTIVLLVISSAGGIVAFAALPVTQMPNIDLPIVSVEVRQENASANEVEQQITKLVEMAVSGLSNLRHIQSSISEGMSTTTVEFRIGTPIERAVTDVRDAVANVGMELPQTADEPIVRRIEVEGGPIVTYAVSSSTLAPEELSWFIDDRIARTLQGVSGVGRVSREGGVEREIGIQLDPYRLRAAGVTASEVNRQVRETNVERSGGRGRLAGQEQTLRVNAAADTVEKLSDTRIILPGGGSIALSAIGEVTDGAAEQRMSALLDGEPVVAFSVYRAKGFSDPQVAALVGLELARLRITHPDVRIDLIDDTTESVQSDYAAAIASLLEGAFLTVVVVYLFLRDTRATLISALAIPLSILPTFMVMTGLGFSLNTISLLAVILVTGVLVDDAIVEIENIARHRQAGKSPLQAAVDASAEIGLAVLATTAAIVAVFIPVSFMTGIAGQYFKQFGVTVAVAVFFSFLVARLLTPLMGAYLLGSAGPARRSKPTALDRAYDRVLRSSTRFRYSTACIGLAVFGVSIALAMRLPAELLPEEDVARSVAQFELPPGITMSQAIERAEELTSVVRARNEIESVYVTVGAPTGDDGEAASREVRKGKAVIKLKARAERMITQRSFEEQMVNELSVLPDLRMHFVKQDGGRDFAIQVAGQNARDVEATASGIVQGARVHVPELLNLSMSAGIAGPQIEITPDMDKAAVLGVSPEQVADAIRLATVGDSSRNLAKYSAADRQLDIRVRLSDAVQRDQSFLEDIQLRTQAGDLISLAAVADLSLGMAATAIDRYDRARRVVIEADLRDGAGLQNAIDAVMALPEATSRAQGVTISELGDAALMEEVFDAFTLAVWIGLALVYAVLTLLFSSFIHPITILLSLPLSIVGAVAALLVTSNPFSMPVIIGFLMLIAIVAKNAILLVDYAIVEVANGARREEAIVAAGRKRARPIIMTTVAMTAGMLPSALSLAEGGAFRAPMAIAVIGGLVSSTLLSLVLVPALYTIVDDVGSLLGRGAQRLLGRNGIAVKPGKIEGSAKRD